MTSITNHRELAQAAIYISSGVHWGTTPEGHEFWDAVHRRLNHWAQGRDGKEHLLNEYLVPLPDSVGRSRSQKLADQLQATVDAQNTQIAQLLESNAKLKRRLLALDLYSARFPAGW